MASDTKTLIETAVTRFLDEVPALANLKLVAGLELRARGDVQMYRVEVPGPKVTKDIAADSKVRISLPLSPALWERLRASWKRDTARSGLPISFCKRPWC